MIAQGLSHSARTTVFHRSGSHGHGASAKRAPVMVCRVGEPSKLNKVAAGLAGVIVSGQLLLAPVALAEADLTTKYLSPKELTEQHAYNPLHKKQALPGDLVDLGHSGFKLKFPREDKDARNKRILSKTEAGRQYLEQQGGKAEGKGDAVDERAASGDPLLGKAAKQIKGKLKEGVEAAKGLTSDSG